MANKTISMDSLKEGAVRIYNGMIAIYPQFAQEEALDVSELVPKFNGCYATNNSTVCFVSDNEVFVTPYTRVTMNSLHAANFCEKYFYVPFSNGDYPKYERTQWNTLLEEARRSHAKDFADDCATYCDEHHIGTIKEETLKNCFIMPSTGVRVKHFYFESCYYPAINSEVLDSTAADSIGHFCTNNGKVVFVYRDGKTYVAKGYKILEELRAAGYTEKGLFVPFSNGEQIQDYVMRERWESITK